MFRALIIIVLLAIIGAGVAWYSMQSLPSWYDSSTEQTQQQLSQKVRERGVRQYLGDKVSDVKNGRVMLTEEEFNVIFLTSLQRSSDGQKLLEVSDAVKAFLHKGEVELSAIINLDKVEAVNPDARKAVEQFDRIFPFLNGSRVALTVYGTPVVRNGSLGIKDDFHIKVGALPFSNDTLRGLGVDVERANTTNLALRYMTIKSMDLQDDQVLFDVAPKF